MIPLNQVNERTKLLSHRLIELSAENEHLKNARPITESHEGMIEALQRRCQYLESLQSDEQAQS
jgi:hypothetical protein